MSITISNPVEQNVVNVGDEISSSQLAAIQGALNPSSSNPFATIADVGNGGGGGNPFNQSLNTNDDVMFGNVTVMYGLSLDATSPGITFPDNTVQTTAYTGSGGGNPFDQTLNTADAPSFAGVNVGNGLFGDPAIELSTTFVSAWQDGEVKSTFNASGVQFGNGTSLAKGTFDNGLGGSNGISLNCAVGYELNWQGGQLKVTTDGGVTASPLALVGDLQIFPQSGGGLMEFYVNDTDGIKTLSPFDGTFSKLYSSALRFYDSGGNQLLELSGYYLTLPFGVSSGIVFGDGTTQTTAYTGGGGGGGNPFDQTLNIADNVAFNQVTTPTIDGSNMALSNGWTLNYNNGLAFFDYGPSGSGISAKLNVNGLELSGASQATFNDTTKIQFASYNSTTNYIDKTGIHVVDDSTNIGVHINCDTANTTGVLSAQNWVNENNIRISGNALTFAKPLVNDVNVWVDPVSVGTAIHVSNQNHISADDYPDELVLTINGVQYAVPARNLSNL